MPSEFTPFPARMVKPTYYKDYHKEVKDLLTRNHSAPASWKVESKYKGPKGQLYVNPSASSDGKCGADVEYALKDHPVAVKLHVNAAQQMKGTATFADFGHKAEVTLDNKGSYELSHEWAFQDRLCSHEKLVKDALEVGVGVRVHPMVQVGADAVYNYTGKQNMAWTASCRFTHKGRVLNIRTNNGATLTVGALTPLRIEKFNATVAAELVYEKEALSGTLGCEMKCPLFYCNTLKARVNKEKKWAVTYIAKLADSWTASITFDKDKKAGLIFSHS